MASVISAPSWWFLRKLLRNFHCPSVSTIIYPPQFLSEREISLSLPIEDSLFTKHSLNSISDSRENHTFLQPQAGKRRNRAVVCLVYKIVYIRVDRSIHSSWNYAGGRARSFIRKIRLEISHSALDFFPLEGSCFISDQNIRRSLFLLFPFANKFRATNWGELRYKKPEMYVYKRL